MSSPDPASPASDDLAQRARALADEIGRRLAKGDVEALPPEAVQALIAAACRAYTASAEAGAGYPIVAGRDALTSTDVMIACSALLKAADLQIFELGMWSSWTGR
ncbi:MAG TPA: hypothetical protein VG271_07310 [Beijerinckiaceae bacterium]|nr:hypothetical protein [Beijerinckiaceae bacterium]